ncbi:MAG TPA: hypothetical protein VJR89_34015 [Polyangiales bacterium]|nr:hypothetical protein [Polyangiales bacterium]
MFTRAVGFLLLPFVSALFAWSARAQDTPATPAQDVPEYTLKQHRFPNPTYLPTPFVSTHVRFQQGVYYIEVPNFPLNRRRDYDVQAVGITERLTVGVRFLDRFHAYILGQGQLLCGVNATSIILGGTTYNYTLGGGLAARLFRSEESGSQVSLRAQFTSGPLGQLDLLAFTNALIDDPPPSIQNIFDLHIVRSSLASGTESVFRTQLTAAQTISRYFGVQGYLGFAGYWESIVVYDPEGENYTEASSNQFKPEGGVAFDTTPFGGEVPLAFNLEYTFEAQRRNWSEGAEAHRMQVVHTLGLGAHVMDARFQCGLSFGTILGIDPIERAVSGGETIHSDTPWNLYGQLQMQYLW